MEFLAIILLIVTVLQIYILSQKFNVLDFEKWIVGIGLVFLIFSFSLEMCTLKFIYEGINFSSFNIFLAIYIVCVLALNIFIYLYGREKKRITRNSIKQAIDLSNTGILLLNKYGEIIMINSLMEEILSEANIKKDFVENIKKHSLNKVGKDYLIKGKGKVYLFVINELSGEILAEDITNEYNLQKAIDNQNKEIEKNNEKILKMIDDMEKMEKEKELQKLKSTFHDMLGYKLSILHQYLIQEGNSKMSFNDIRWMMEDVFKDIQVENVSKQNLDEMIKIYKSIGVNVIINGDLPKDDKKAKIFIEIIREAITNAIKHANTDEITINMSVLDDKNLMTITNNGILPKDKIVENDGIRGMRKRLSSINGTLKISTKNRFKIEATA